MEEIQEVTPNVNRKHACDEVKYDALYGYYFLGLSRTQLSKTYDKTVSTISNWIQHYQDTGSVERAKRHRVPTKFDEEKVQFLLNLYHENPILYLDEAKKKFQSHFDMTISTSRICKLLRDNSMTWKTLERRALEIKDMEIVRFMTELSSIDWHYINLVFLGEVSLDAHGMLRTKGHRVVGKKLIYRGEFTRKPQISMLAFLGQNGILDTFTTYGTYDRLTFFRYCKDFALGGVCQKYPGRNSVWILDGAMIHCPPSIIRYLQSLGIFPILLPPHTPFFNPFEYIFDIVRKNVKKSLFRGKKDVELMVNEEFTKMRHFPCTEIFKKCGYVMSGRFDPKVAYEQEQNENDTEMDEVNPVSCTDQ